MKKSILPLIVITLLVISCKDKKKNSPLLDSEPKLEADGVPPPPPKIEKHSETDIVIIPIEHATAILEWKDITVYVDPVGGSEAFKDQKQPDLILITDIHGDHFNLETIHSLNTKNAKIIVPQAVADKMPEEFTPQIDVLNNGDSKNRYGIKVEAIPMYNLREEAKKFHVKGRGNGYVLNMEGQRIYFSGDTEDIPEMRALKNIDKAFVCMNLPYTMTVESAADAVLEFKPKQVYPYHYRGKPDIGDVAKFKKFVNKTNPDIEVIQLDWYPNDAF
ncbi:MBL fold metallo-hydrolase [Maribacter sp. HTCC2170]|uniref:MBL fold metallo-hydrolase n=1 Tax=Maribacter sp. (strain HTCC2170 / KCCM 42371) TaxID=313603 RepID=UPI00006B21EC|nr:MBL fold metallo-hydrolase [Maribacter sp. HTCC2170]EAR00300.1 putative metal-dependent hydrolase [Maribacter sp. HTCC2170]